MGDKNTPFVSPSRRPLRAFYAMHGAFGMHWHRLNYLSVHRHPKVEPVFGGLFVHKPLPWESHSLHIVELLPNLQPLPLCL